LINCAVKDEEIQSWCYVSVEKREKSNHHRKIKCAILTAKVMLGIHHVEVVVFVDI